MKHDMQVQIGQLIRALRKEKKIGREQLALLVNISASQLGRIERGQSLLSDEMIHRILCALQAVKDIPVALPPASPTELAKQLDYTAAYYGRSRNAEILWALRQYIKRFQAEVDEIK